VFGCPEVSYTDKSDMGTWLYFIDGHGKMYISTEQTTVHWIRVQQNNLRWLSDKFSILRIKTQKLQKNYDFVIVLLLCVLWSVREVPFTVGC